MIYPGDRELTERERTNICYLAFPDSNSGLMGNVQFHFRIRQCAQSMPLHLRPAIHKYNATCPTSIQVKFIKIVVRIYIYTVHKMES